MEKVVVVLLMLLIALVSSIAIAIIKSGLDKSKKIINALFNAKVIAGAFLYVATSIFFVLLLKSEELSFLFPLTATSYIFIMIISRLYLKEEINKYKIMSVVLIILGVVLLSY